MSGYCKIFIVLSRLESELKFHGILFRDKTVCIDQLVANVQSVLVANGYLHAKVALLNKSELVTAELLAYRLLCDPDAIRHS